MNKEELAIAKRIAEIEGVKSPTFRMPLDEYVEKHYNPFEWGILGPLMVKYKVDNEHRNGVVAFTIWLNDEATTAVSIEAKSTEEIPRAILECIIKSQEK